MKSALFSTSISKHPEGRKRSAGEVFRSIQKAISEDNQLITPITIVSKR
jgi:hypothetical protein